MTDKEKEKGGFNPSKMMGPLMGIVMVGVVAGVASSLSGNTTPVTTYTCPYGDNLTFSTSAALAAHVQTAHPGERTPIDITW